MQGWVRLHRKTLESAIFDNADLFKVWSYCLLKASHKEHELMVGNQLVKLEPGEFVFGRKKAAIELNMTETSTWRRIKKLETLGNLNIKSNNKFSVISVVNWLKYQTENNECEHQNGQQKDNKWTTDGQQVDTNNNVKNGNNVNNVNNIGRVDETEPKEQIPYKEIINYLNEKTGKAFQSSAASNQKLIKARWNEGYRVDDFKKVVDNMTTNWKGQTFSNGVPAENFLQPSTLFGSKFDKYLNQVPYSNSNSMGVNDDYDYRMEIYGMSKEEIEEKNSNKN